MAIASAVMLGPLSPSPESAVVTIWVCLEGLPCSIGKPFGRVLKKRLFALLGQEELIENQWD